MKQGKMILAGRGLLVLSGVIALVLGWLRILSLLDIALLLVIGVLLWKGLLKPAETATACPAPSSPGSPEPVTANEKFWTLFNGTSDAAFLRNDFQFMGTATYSEVNDMACRRLGYSREEFKQMRPCDIDVMQSEESIEEIRRLLDEKGCAVFESALKAKSGEEYPAEVHVHRMELGGQPVILSMLRDITARKHTEQLMKRLSQAVEQSPVSILITDTHGAIEFVNSRLTETTGFTHAELLGENPSILGSGLTPPRVYEELWGAIKIGKVWEGELQNKKKNGEMFWEHSTVAPIMDARGTITHYMSFKEDITAQKQLQNQLRHSQKLEAVGQLAGGVAHDFNNILQVINGYGTLIQMSLQEQDANRTAIAEILKAAERAAHLTHSLLAFSRKQIMNPKTVDLNAVVSNVDKFLRRVIGEDIQVVALHSDEPMPVLVDIGQVEQVIMNLATNARDAMPAGGTLSICTDVIDVDDKFIETQQFLKPGRFALLSISDTGGGMDEATLKRIFDPFFSTKEMGRGTGLGLSIVYGIIKQHGGYICAESEHGEGTTFKIYLPLVSRGEDLQGQAIGIQHRVKGTETVLVAEDEPQVRTMVELVLKKYGYTVIMAQDGQEAVEKFQAHRDAIKLILMDIIMPRKSGRQAYDEIRLQAPQVKVLFTSGYTADFIKSRGELDQDMELVMKPVQPLDLLRKMRELLDRPASG